jgi:hypothetical protein
VGFGGLLLLMAFAEFDGIRALFEMQTANDDSVTISRCWNRTNERPSTPCAASATTIGR